MSTDPRPGPDAAALKRRKVRKGTHSCCECRRRKVRCQFAADNNVTCLPCQEGARTCRRQEFIDEHDGAKVEDRGLAQRLGRVEAMMARLMRRVMEDEKKGSRAACREASPAPSDRSADVGALETSIPEDAPVGQLLGLRHFNAEAGSSASMVTPEPDNSTPAPTIRRDKHDKIAHELHAMFPSQREIDLIVDGSVMAATMVTAQFSRMRDAMEGTTATAAHVRVVPPVTSHPTVLSRRLMQLAICMQALPQDFDESKLHIEGTVRQLMHRYVTAVAKSVTSDDELVGTMEGLETSVLVGFWHANMGNLRIAWLSYRRAMSLAQLMGIHKGETRSLTYADPAGPRTEPAAVWYRIMTLDRHLSLLLSLPVGSRDDSFAAGEAVARDTHMERLGKQYTVVAARIIERNATQACAAAHALTLAIDRQLDEAGRAMSAEWWAEPDVESAMHKGGLDTINVFKRTILQICHFDMLILLHLPYLLRDPTEGHEHAKATCVNASRAVLRRFLRFRAANTSAFSCRHVDYSALIAAMTLLLAYLRQHGQPTQYVSCSQRYEDRTLVELVRERMLHVALLNRDQLSREAADMIGQMMPMLNLVDDAMAPGAGVGSESAVAAIKMLHLNVPYLGTINFQPSTACSDMNPLSTAMAMHPVTPVDGQTQMTMASPNDMAINGMFMQFEPQPQPPNPLPELPEMTAEAADWAFQGVDTTYWSLLNNSGTDFASAPDVQPRLFRGAQRCSSSMDPKTLSSVI